MAVSTLDHGIPHAVLGAALALHQSKNTDLISDFSGNNGLVSDESNSLWSLVGSTIRFSSLEARNQCSALAMLPNVNSLNLTNSLVHAACELWRNEAGHPDLASVRLLVIASQTLNVLKEFASTIKNNNGCVFEILRLLEKVLPLLPNLRAEDIVEVVEAQHEFTKRDMAVGMLFNSIERRLRSEPEIAWDIWRLTRGNMSESMQSLYSTALQSLMCADQQSLALERARDDADAIDPLIAGSALWTVGRAVLAHQLNHSELDKCITVLTSKTGAISIEIQRAATRAVAHAAIKEERLMSELVRLAVRADEYTLAVIADFLFMNQQALPVSSPHFERLLKALIGLLPSQKNAMDNFDWVLHQLYAAPEQRSLVLDCLNQWLIQHGGLSLNDKALVELFDQTIMQIANDAPGFRAVITRWLVAPEKQLAVAFVGLISYLNIRGLKSPSFSPEVLNSFALPDFRLLARRLVGYVISEEPLLALTLSLLETNDAPNRTFGWVYALLTEDIGRDFPHATTQALTARLKTADSPEKELLTQIHDVLLQRSKARDGLPRLQELK